MTATPLSMPIFFSLCFIITIQPRLAIFDPCIDDGGYMSAQESHVSSDIEVIFVVTVKLYKVFVIRSVSPLPYNVGSPYLIHTLKMDGKCLYLSMSL